jgi:hypothetical protein
MDQRGTVKEIIHGTGGRQRCLVLLGACRFLGAQCMFACRTELAIFRMPEADPLSARAVQARSFAGNGTSTYKYCIKWFVCQAGTSRPMSKDNHVLDGPFLPWELLAISCYPGQAKGYF